VEAGTRPRETTSFDAGNSEINSLMQMKLVD
jgi:hypothetical protein